MKKLSLILLVIFALTTVVSAMQKVLGVVQIKHSGARSYHLRFPGGFISRGKLLENPNTLGSFQLDPITKEFAAAIKDLDPAVTHVTVERFSITVDRSDNKDWTDFDTKILTFLGSVVGGEIDVTRVIDANSNSYIPSPEQPVDGKRLYVRTSDDFMSEKMRRIDVDLKKLGIKNLPDYDTVSATDPSFAKRKAGSASEWICQQAKALDGTATIGVLNGSLFVWVDLAFVKTEVEEILQSVLYEAQKKFK